MYEGRGLNHLRMTLFFIFFAGYQLVRSGVDVNYHDEKKRSLLHIAAAKGYPKIGNVCCGHVL